MKKEFLDLLIFFLISYLGIVAEGKLADRMYRADHRFRFQRYFLLLAGPLLATAFAIKVTGLTAFYMFMASAVAGVILEYRADRAYAHIVGARLWKYYRYDLDGNTSWLVVPVWGMAGVFFLLLARVVEAL